MINKIQVGAVVVNVVEIPDLTGNHVKDGEKLWGHVSYQDHAIQIEKNQFPTMKNQTLWHEIIHIVLDNAGMSDHSGDEVLVSVLANGVSQVLLNNKEMRDGYLQD